MHKPLWLLMGLVLALGACQPPSASGGRTRTRGTTPPAAASASPASDARYLKKPTAKVKTLQGRIAIDAHYVVTSGRGKLIGQAGTNAIAAGGGNIIGQAGSNAILLDGSPLVGQAGSNAIAAGGGNLIGQSGSNAIAAGGGNAIAAGGGNYRLFGLLQATELAIGTIMPAAGMELFAYSLLDGKAITLGETDDGQPVYSIFTDADGNYAIHLPATLKGRNVRIEARPANAEDPRLRYQLIRPHGSGTQAVIDEDTALVTALVFEIFVSQLDPILKDPVGTIADLYREDRDPLEKILLASVRPTFEAIAKIGEQQGTQSKSDAERREIGRKACYAALGYSDLDEIVLEVSGKKALDVLLEALRDGRELATRNMLADPDYYAKQSFILDANRVRAEAGLPPYVIKRPSDLGDYYRQEVFANPEFSKLSKGLDKQLERAGVDKSQHQRLSQAAVAIMTHFLVTLARDEEARCAVLNVLQPGFDCSKLPI